MPTVNGLGAAGSLLDRQLDQLADTAKRMQTRGEQAAARAMQAAVAANLGGNPIVMRGVGKFGARVGVRVSTLGGQMSGPGFIAAGGSTVVVRMTGPAHLLERDTNRHPVGTGALGDAHGHRMRMPDGRWVTGPFTAGGSEGKYPFRRGVEEARPVLARVLQAEVNAAARSIFR